MKIKEIPNIKRGGVLSQKETCEFTARMLRSTCRVYTCKHEECETYEEKVFERIRKMKTIMTIKLGKEAK